jgi:hypothetical protein
MTCGGERGRPRGLWRSEKSLLPSKKPSGGSSRRCQTSISRPLRWWLKTTRSRCIFSQTAITREFTGSDWRLWRVCRVAYLRHLHFPRRQARFGEPLGRQLRHHEGARYRGDLTQPLQSTVQQHGELASARGGPRKCPMSPIVTKVAMKTVRIQTRPKREVHLRK